MIFAFLKQASLTLFQLNCFVKLKIFHSAHIYFWACGNFCAYQLKVDCGYISLHDNISASTQDIDNPKTPQ